MKNEPASNIIPSIYIIGILILNTWGNGWVVMFFSVAGLPFLFWLMPVEMRKPILKSCIGVWNYCYFSFFSRGNSWETPLNYFPNCIK